MKNLIIMALETAMLLICLSLSDDDVGEALVAFLTGHFFAAVILGISLLVIKIGGM